MLVTDPGPFNFTVYIRIYDFGAQKWLVTLLAWLVLDLNRTR
jgi:hypothetical protein